MRSKIERKKSNSARLTSTRTRRSEQKEERRKMKRRRTYDKTGSTATQKMRVTHVATS